jgi:hypothetical protein
MTIEYLDSIVLPEEIIYLVPYNIYTIERYIKFLRKQNIYQTFWSRITLFQTEQFGWEVNDS